MRAVYIHKGMLPIGTVVSINVFDIGMGDSKVIPIKTENGVILDDVQMLAICAGETPEDFAVLEELTQRIRKSKKFLIFKEAPNEYYNFYALSEEIKPGWLRNDLSRREYVEHVGCEAKEVYKREVFAKLALEIAREEGLSLYLAEYDFEKTAFTLSEMVWCELGYISIAHGRYHSIGSLLFEFAHLENKSKS